MERLIRLTGAVVLIVFWVAACGKSTQFVLTYKDPAAEPLNWKGQKLAAFVFSSSEATRRSGELALARQLSQRGVQGVPGYEIVPANLSREGEKDKARELLKDAGVVGAVVMRVVGRSQRIDSSPGAYWLTGSYYSSFWGYWGYGWSAVYQPGYMNTETVVTVETLVYSIADDKLVWAGRSSTTDPKNVQKFIRELCAAAGNEIRKSGLVRD